MVDRARGTVFLINRGMDSRRRVSKQPPPQFGYAIFYHTKESPGESSNGRPSTIIDHPTKRKKREKKGKMEKQNIQQTNRERTSNLTDIPSSDPVRKSGFYFSQNFRHRIYLNSTVWRRNRNYPGLAFRRVFHNQGLSALWHCVYPWDCMDP